MEPAVLEPAVPVDWTFNGLWRYQPRYIATSFGRCAYVDEGAGSAHAVLLLHGNPTWSFLWRHAIAALVSSGHRVIAPDLLGFGRSDKPDLLAAYTLEHHVERLSLLWKSLHVQEVSLVVHGWGGPIGLWWLHQSHVALRCLVVFNTFSPVLPGKQGQTVPLRLSRFASRYSSVADYLYRHLHIVLRDFLFAGGMVHHEALTPPVRAAYLEPHLRPEDRTGVLAFPLQIPRLAGDPIARRSASVAAELKPILNAVPSVLCWGMRDCLFDATTLRTWMDFLPHARVIRLEHASHYVPEDTPDLAVSAIVNVL